LQRRQFKLNIQARKVLVCITAQSNSKRLIQYGYDVAKSLNGELHVLHVVKGNNIFISDDSSRLLQNLFEYGSARNAVVHALCGDNVTETINKFVKSYKITDLVLGVLNDALPVKSENVYEKLKWKMPYVEIHLLERE